MNAISIDPGLATGVAFRTVEGYKTLVIAAHEVHELYKLIIEHDYDWISVEQFQTANVISRYGLRTTELVGAVECLAWLSKTPCIRRTPQSRLPMMHVAKEMLKGKPGLVDHEIDALAQMLTVERDIELGRIKLAI